MKRKEVRSRNKEEETAKVKLTCAYGDVAYYCFLKRIQSFEELLQQRQVTMKRRDQHQIHDLQFGISYFLFAAKAEVIS